jgi:hypothetical protein
MNALTGNVIKIHAFGGGSSLRKDDGVEHTAMLLPYRVPINKDTIPLLAIDSGSPVGYGQHEDIYYFLWRRSSINASRGGGDG